MRSVIPVAKLKEQQFGLKVFDNGNLHFSVTKIDCLQKGCSGTRYSTGRSFADD